MIITASEKEYLAAMQAEFGSVFGTNRAYSRTKKLKLSQLSVKDIDLIYALVDKGYTYKQVRQRIFVSGGTIAYLVRKRSESREAEYRVRLKQEYERVEKELRPAPTAEQMINDWLKTRDSNLTPLQ